MATVALHYFEVLRNQEMVAARVANVGLFEDLVAFVRNRQSNWVAWRRVTGCRQTERPQLENETSSD